MFFQKYIFCLSYWLKNNFSSFHGSDSQLIWPPWRKFSTVDLQNNELLEYVRKIFSQKFYNSPKNDAWIINGIQGVHISYVSSSIHFDFY